MFGIEPVCRELEDLIDQVSALGLEQLGQAAFGGEPGWGHTPETGVGALVVVIVAPAADYHLRHGQRWKTVDAQALVPKPAIETLAKGVLARLARLYEPHLHPPSQRPLPEILAAQL